ncbi:MAG: tetratricopeptide repeat protein [Burkholderiales bacterium]|nr:tetratricopeptide repeat protein [Burkholderiales bacterium]
MEQAVQAHREGKLAQAASLYRAVLDGQPDHARALGLLGLIEHDSGRSEIGVELLRKSIKVDPTIAAMQVNLGTVLAESGLHEEALEHFQVAIQLTPNDLSAIENTILLLRKLNRLAEATSHIERAAELQPDSALAQFRLAVSCLEREDFSRGYDLLHKGPLSNASLPGLNLHKAAATLAIGKAKAALDYAQRAVAESPQSGEVLVVFARCVAAMGRGEEAVSHFRRAISLGASAAEVKAEAIVSLSSAGRLDLAEMMLNELNQERPLLAQELNLNVHLATKHWDLGDDSVARRILQPVTGLSRSAHEHVAMSLMIPQILDSEASIGDIRKSYESNLDRLLEQPPELTLPRDLVGTSNFYLAFHGQDNKALLSKFCALCRAMDPSLNYVAPHCGPGPRMAGPIRIGFMTRFVMNHSVTTCFSKIVEAASAEGDFDVFLISNSSLEDEHARQNYGKVKGTKVQLRDGDVAESRQILGNLGLDILVYMDIGMDHDTYCLALCRLAPIQVVLGGHPDTTGISTIDFHISSELAEIPEADHHYSETLVRLPIGAFYFERPTLPKTHFGYQKNRVQLGLPAKGRVYICPSTLQKLHPEFDFAIDQLLARDPDGHVILFQSPIMPAWNRIISKRLDRSIDSTRRNRVHFLPWIREQTDFANTLVCADVILDPFYFGLGSTSIFTVHAGIPTVSMPTTFLRGRTGYFFSKLLNIPDSLAANPTEYVEKAITIAQNKDFREHLSRKIIANSDVLYENMQGVDDFLNWLRGLSVSKL